MGQFELDPDAITTSYFACGDIAEIGPSELREIGHLSRQAGGPARYNLHTSRHDDLHCMAILQPAGVYAKPRLHTAKSKVFQFISGDMVVITFGDNGEVRSLHRLAPGETLIVRISPGIFHTNCSLSEQAMYHEVMTGPYEPGQDDRQYADFGPLVEDQETGRTWIHALIAQERPDLLSPGEAAIHRG